MSIKKIDDLGALTLIEAIVDRTVIDFMATTPGSEARKEIEEDILSAHFETLTGLDGKVFLKSLREQYEQKHKKARKDKHHENNQD